MPGSDAPLRIGCSLCGRVLPTPDVQWTTGLFGYAAFVVVLNYCRPNMPRIIAAGR